MICYPTTPKRWAMLAGCFSVGCTLFGVGLHFSYVNVAPQQARIQARNDFVRERIKQRRGGQ